jgi:hypothetical protein
VSKITLDAEMTLTKSSVGLLIVLPSLVIFWALNHLLASPSLANCDAPQSTSTRLACADQVVDEQEAEKLKQAIALIEDIPTDDPLRDMRDRKLEQWSESLLDLAEATFQKGKLEEAILLTRGIPSTTPTYLKANDKVIEWRSIWAKAQQIYQQAERSLGSETRSASLKATELLSVGNEYWATTKYAAILAQLPKQTVAPSPQPREEPVFLARAIVPKKTLAPKQQSSSMRMPKVEPEPIPPDELPLPAAELPVLEPVTPVIQPVPVVSPSPTPVKLVR